jgi:hypothetical protein
MLDRIMNHCIKQISFLGLIFFFSKTSLYAQRDTGSYSVTVKEHLAVSIHANDICERSLLAVFQDNSTQTVYDYGCTENYDNTQTFTVTVKANNRIVSYIPYYHRKWGGCWTCAKGEESGNGPTLTIPNSSYDNCNALYFQYLYPTNTFTGEVWITNTPVLNNALQQPSDNVFPTEDPISILAPVGFNSPVYNWEYYTDDDISTQQVWIPPHFPVSGRWETVTTVNAHPFPQQYQGLDSIHLTATDLFAGSGVNVNDLISKNVYVRLNACGGNTPSNSIILNIRKSPPHVTSIVTFASSCFDSDNGHVKLSFDRALLPQEKIQFNLVNANNPSLFFDLATDTFDVNGNYLIPQDLPPAKYIIKYNARTFTQSGDESWSNIITTDTINISAPTAVAFTTNKTDVWCYDGSDGVIKLNATGGVGNYRYMIKRQGQPDSLWYNFSAATAHNMNRLSADNYEIQVKDGNDCYAKTAAYGAIIAAPVTINQPAAPLQINEVQKANPTAFGYSNGYFVADITGGTPNADAGYNYQVKQINSAIITSGITTTVTGSGYRLRVDGLADGTYILNTDDRNRSSATTAQGCMATDTIVITQPQPLTLKFEIVDSVLCKDDANGTLTAHATGGVAFGLPALPYQYTWKKKGATGTYQVMTAYQDSVAANLSSGWYAVNITDANSISLVSDSVFFLPEPAELLVNLSKVDVTCSGLPNGQVYSTVTGGTQPYNYYWNTSDETTSISNLPAGTYMVWIDDYHGCQTQKNIVVSQPNDIQLQVTKKDPTCNNGSDGFINVAVSGGSMPFTYNWAGAVSSTSNASNLKSGTYSVKITDANGCNLVQTDTLINPEPILVDLGPDRYICSAQQIDYDISVNNKGSFTYNWSSNVGFTSNSPKVSLTQAGTYYATVKDANNCTGTDMLVLTAINTQVSNDFALPTQGYAGEKIVIANLTSPQADSVRWSLPANANVISKTDQMVEMILQDTGSYYVSLRAFKGLCYADQIKKIIINKQGSLPDPGNTRSPFILDFSAAPIPNNGSFTVRITLQSASQIELKLINVLTSQITTLTKQSGSDTYTIPVNDSLSAGTYVLLLETPNGRETIKLLIL